jgi:hypothetical protein
MYVSTPNTENVVTHRNAVTYCIILPIIFNCEIGLYNQTWEAISQAKLVPTLLLFEPHTNWDWTESSGKN